ncbi:MAG: anaerobic sulfatase maturase [Verrucomicrobia bacterium]|nr:anaerobic sulfatase maturase [Verrucomicrobiota bacterium]
MGCASVQSKAPFHVMTKPIGPLCNLDCTYCFYLEKEALFKKGDSRRMQPDVLETYIRDYIESQPNDFVSFAWQGGEPTLLGVDYFRKAVEIQKKYANGKKIENAFQTNGTLIDDEWCEFFKQNDFLIGLSIDGPRALHDAYRIDKRRKPTFDLVMRGIKFLQKHSVRFNTLTCVNRKNMKSGKEVYKFLKSIGSDFMQFIPIVERKPGKEEEQIGFWLAEPPSDTMEEEDDLPVTAWSVRPQYYGQFLCDIFDEWIQADVGKIYVQMFDTVLGKWLGVPGGLCIFSETCGSAMAIEHTGDVYSCDHYVYGKHKVGNIMEQSLGEIVESPQQKKFGNDKRDSLPKMCQECEFKFACNGGCPKQRFMKTPAGDPGLNYLCQGYMMFYKHSQAAMLAMAQLYRMGRPPAEIMSARSRK